MDRFLFAEAIAEDTLLARPWKQLSLPQQVVLKALYGLPLTTEKELLIWSGFQGQGEYDELGYLTGITREVPYVPKEYSILTGIMGRRSGKSTVIGAFSSAYEITLGGHPQYAQAGQELDYVYVAQDMNLATKNMMSIVRTLEQSPMLRKEIVNRGAETVEFRNNIVLRAMPSNIKSSRGSAVVGVIMDELGFWYKDAKSANPDKEVEIAFAYALQQFEPWAKQLRMTTPWTKEGLAYEASVAGTEGRLLPKGTDPDEVERWEDHLVVYAPTAAMDIPEPLVTRKKLARKKKRDPEAFARESLAKFIDSQTGFLSHTKINEAIEAGKALPKDRPFLPDANYVAVMDPAFRSDEYTLTIGHHDTQLGVVQDFLKAWTPEPGARLNPALILDETKEILDRFELSLVYSDQHQLESLQQLALDRDFTVFGHDLTVKSKPKVMQSLSLALNRNKLVLLDDPVQKKQLQELQRTVQPSGHYTIAAPPGKHDDRATVLGLMVHLAEQLPAAENAPTAAAQRDKNKGHMKAEMAAVFEALVQSGDQAALAAIEHAAYLNALTDHAPTPD